MDNFIFHSPTKIIFGKDTELQAGSETALHAKKVLLHYGGGSVKKSGLYDRVKKSLSDAGVEAVELGGAQPNPRLKLVKKGIELCREKGISFILAVGGGSVIDSAKAISVGVPYSGDVWDFYDGKAVPQKALPVGVILTIPAAGSESSPSSTIELSSVMPTARSLPTRLTCSSTTSAVLGRAGGASAVPLACDASGFRAGRGGAC